MALPSSHHSKPLSTDDTNKKELKQETADMRGFTLMFEDTNMELKWNMAHLDRHIAITTRYLFWASFFQGLFFWGDVLENYGDRKEDSQALMSSYLFHLGLIRLLLGIFPLISCFLVSTGLLIPTQMTVFWMNLCYGVPSLAIFYLLRPSPSHWDSLFMIYGLCFCMLPKISPLNFIFGFSSAVIFTCIFIYISAFRLSLQSWLLSNTLLSFIAALFCYQTYSSERSSRERWLLRERLQLERIDLRIVASSIQDDLKRVSHDHDTTFQFDQMVYTTTNTNRSHSLLASINPQETPCPSILTEISSNSQPSSLITPLSNSKTQQRDRLVLFVKGISAWAICYGMGYTFDHGGEVNSSAAFALLMHTMGFSVFLVYITGGQLRWIALNGLIGISLLWLFSQTGMDNKWVVFSTHSVGYILLLTVIIVMFLIFGGVVLVWSHLIDFLKEVISRYPHVKDELSENKVLEQVLIGYISDLPLSLKNKLLKPIKANNTDVNNNNNSASKAKLGGLLQVTKDIVPCNNISSSTEDSENNINILHHRRVSKSKPNTTKLNNISTTTTQLVNNETDITIPHYRIVTNRNTNNTTSNKHNKDKSSSSSSSLCFFCRKAQVEYFVPACNAWKQQQQQQHDESTPPSNTINMCTPYTSLVQERDELCCTLTSERNTSASISTVHTALSIQHSEVVAALEKANARIRQLEQMYMSYSTQTQNTIEDMNKAHEERIKTLLSEHNAQLSAYKKSYKSIALQKLQQHVPKSPISTQYPLNVNPRQHAHNVISKPPLNTSEQKIHINTPTPVTISPVAAVSTVGNDNNDITAMQSNTELSVFEDNTNAYCTDVQSDVQYAFPNFNFNFNYRNNKNSLDEDFRSMDDMNMNVDIDMNSLDLSVSSEEINRLLDFEIFNYTNNNVDTYSKDMDDNY